MDITLHMEICFFHQLWLQEFGASMWAQVCFFRMKPGTKILMHSGGCNARLNLSLGLLGCSIAERAGGVGRVGIVGRSKLCKLKLDKFWFGVSSVDSLLLGRIVYISQHYTCFHKLSGPSHCMCHFMHLLFHDLAMVQGQVIFDQRCPPETFEPMAMEVEYVTSEVAAPHTSK